MDETQTTEAEAPAFVLPAEEAPEAVTPAPALAAVDADVDQAAQAPEPEPQEEEEDPVEILQPRTQPIERLLGPPGNQVRYYQKPLSFMGRWEFFSLLGETITKLMDAEEGVTLQQLMQSIGVEPGENVEDQMSQVETIMKGFARLTKVAPNLLDDCFTIWLDIPPAQRQGAQLMMRRPADEGGFDDDEGWDIIEAFIEQNAVEIISFFTERLPSLLEKGTQLRQFADHRRSSRRSRRSQRQDASR